MVDLIPFAGTLLLRVTATNFAKASFWCGSTNSTHSTLLKYVGDAIIVYFPVDTAVDFDVSSERAVVCVLHMLLVVEHGINAIFKQFDFPEVHIKIGIDSGENAIFEYGSSVMKSHVDILGYPMNVTAKITSLATADHILIDDTTYQVLDIRICERLIKFGLKRQ